MAREISMNLEEGSVRLSMGTMGTESWCLLLVWCFWYFVIIALDL